MVWYVQTISMVDSLLFSSLHLHYMKFVYWSKLTNLPCNMLKMVYNPSVQWHAVNLFSNKKWFHNNYFNIWIAFNCYFGAHQSPFDSWTGIQQDRRGSTPSPPLTTEVPWASCWCMTSPIQKPLKTSPSGYGILMRWGQFCCLS